MNGFLNERITDLKDNIHAFWEKLIWKSKESGEASVDLNYERNFEDDMPLHLAKDDGPGVKYYATENSPLSIGAEKANHIGIDSFGEDDSPDPEQSN